MNGRTGLRIAACAVAVFGLAATSAAQINFSGENVSATVSLSPDVTSGQKVTVDLLEPAGANHGGETMVLRITGASWDKPQQWNWGTSDQMSYFNDAGDAVVVFLSDGDGTNEGVLPASPITIPSLPGYQPNLSPVAGADFDGAVMTLNGRTVPVVVGAASDGTNTTPGSISDTFCLQLQGAGSKVPAVSFPGMLALAALLGLSAAWMLRRRASLRAV